MEEQKDWTDDFFDQMFNEEDEEDIALLQPKPQQQLTRKMIELQIVGQEIRLFSKEDLTQGDFQNLINAKHESFEHYNYCVMKLTPLNSFVLRNAMRGFKNVIQKHDAKTLAENANQVPLPHATVTEDRKHIQVLTPNLKVYTKLLDKVNAYPSSTGYRVNLTKVLDLETLVANMDTQLPKITFDKDVLSLNREPILGFDGTLESLKSLPLSLLNIVAANSQSYKAQKTSKQTLEEKMKKMGIKNLHDLLFWLPRRYVDKSNPQDLMDLIVGETAVIVGKISSSSELSSGRGGAIFNVRTDNGQIIRTSFFNQRWLLSKFKKDDEVLVTGKFSMWNGTPQIGGASIDHAEEASLLPIVPVYKQSPSQGITTHTIMSANRELLSRMGDVKLPVYFRKHGRMPYCDALMELHFPSTLKQHTEAVNDLAYYELVYMQLLIQDGKSKSIDKPGIKIDQPGEKLQAKAIKTLPFDLTSSQKKALVLLNKRMSEDVPSTTLVNADVGSGKGLCEDESVLTPSGWVKIKEIQVGDEVIGSNGKPTKVTGVFPQGLQEVAKIEFSDNTEIITDLSHLWAVQPLGQFANKYKDGALPTRIVSTRQLLSEEPSEVEIEQGGNGNSMYKKKIMMQTHFKNSKGGLKWSIPVLSEPVEHVKQKELLPLDPYFFGYWLGDGNSRGLHITVGDQDLLTTQLNLSKCWKGEVIASIGPKKTKDKKSPNTLQFKSEEFAGATKLKEMGVYMNKHIPENYLLSASEERLSLLQGLMDSDGHCSKRGILEFTNNNKNIVDGLLNLVRSLGGIGKVSRIRKANYTNTSGEKVESKHFSYTVIFTLPFGMAPFRLERKLKLYGERIEKLPKRSHGHKKKITNVELLPEKQKTICIKVDAEDELFVTKDFIVTHNTVVAQLSALRAIDSGFQTVLIAPTDILARQLFESFTRVLKGLEEHFGNSITIDYLSGSMKAAEKKPILARIKNGETQIIVGTHSLMTSVEYHNLGYIVVDEQQKFGAEQRTALLNSRKDGRVPDLMMMTATPIPRSTAQVFYGDIDMIELKEKPPGRIPIVTEWVREDPEGIIEELTNPVWQDVLQEAKAGNQTFIITPLVSESDKIDAASAERAYKSLGQLALSGLNIGLVHGQMKQDQQKEEMLKFKNKEYDVLIASTIVEVGVDIPDATRVVVLSAERLGASSLHQIRGRVGRNSKPSKCYLVSLGRTENSQIRLQSLVDSENGFDIAKADLELRGEGKMFSGDQSGRSEMIFANLAKHKEDIERAKEEALIILNSPFRDQALKDSREKFESDTRLM